MSITINETEIEALNGETLLEAALRAGYKIPTLCYVKGFKHKSSCMVCAVKDCVTGQIIPSCATIPTNGMKIETNSEEIKMVRKLSLELLLSDHRADCEAPCSLVCPQGLDIEKMLAFYDNQNYQEAFQTLSEAFPLPEIPCNNCKSLCEKACRRGTIDQAVEIRAIIKELSGKYKTVKSDNEKENLQSSKNMYQSRIGRFTEKEKEYLKTSVTTPSRCLHCACAGRNSCKLRLYASETEIKRSRYETSSKMLAMNKQHVKNNIWFEAAKCIRCGLCIYNSVDGFTFKDRGFEMQVILPDESRGNVGEELVDICPTGALYKASGEVYSLTLC